MNIRLFNEFLSSDDTLRVYEGNRLLFTSHRERLLPLLEYIKGPASRHRKVVILDRVMGNAAALLAVKADCREVYSPLGSQLALGTLKQYGITYHFSRTVPYIQDTSHEHMCPMEKLSIGKQPEEFYEVIRNLSDSPHRESNAEGAG